MSELSSFKKKIAVKAADDTHRHKLRKVTGTHGAAVKTMKARQFRDWESARKLAARVKDHVLARLPELLETFEEKISSRGVQVLWARDAAEARSQVLEIARRHGAKKIVKAKSMTTEELDLNGFLEAQGMEVLETDLGEFIVQLAGEKPYHIVTPAMHKSKEEIGALFHEKLGSPEGATPEELTLVAREHLREAYVTADLGISGANFLVAEEGAISLTENEGNIRLSMSCPPVHVVIAGIEKVLPRLSDLALFFPLLATSGTGQELTCYSSVTRGPKSAGEQDGPEHMVVILLDNGRSELHSRDIFREALRCIRCGACLNACPVYKVAGGHSYGTTYQGPIGSVITPHLRDMARWNHLSFASSLCGACTEVCPVGIDLHRLLLENRREKERPGPHNLFWKAALRVWAHVVSKRRRLERHLWLFRHVEPLVRLLMPRKVKRMVPRLPPKTFAEIWQEKEGHASEESRTDVQS